MLTLEVLQLRTFRVVSYLDNGMLLRCGMSLFSRFLQTELKIHEFEPYPYLLKSPHTECALLLHVDDVLCLAQHDYLRNVLEPAWRKKYKISLEVLEKTGDELS